MATKTNRTMAASKMKDRGPQPGPNRNRLWRGRRRRTEDELKEDGDEGEPQPGRRRSRPHELQQKGKEGEEDRVRGVQAGEMAESGMVSWRGDANFACANWRSWSATGH